MDKTDTMYSSSSLRQLFMRKEPECHVLPFRHFFSTLWCLIARGRNWGWNFIENPISGGGLELAGGSDLCNLVKTHACKKLFYTVSFSLFSTKIS